MLETHGQLDSFAVRSDLRHDTVSKIDDIPDVVRPLATMGMNIDDVRPGRKDLHTMNLRALEKLKAELTGAFVDKSDAGMQFVSIEAKPHRNSRTRLPVGPSADCIVTLMAQLLWIETRTRTLLVKSEIALRLDDPLLGDILTVTKMLKPLHRLLATHAVTTRDSIKKSIYRSFNQSEYDNIELTAPAMLKHYNMLRDAALPGGAIFFSRISHGNRSSADLRSIGAVEPEASLQKTNQQPQQLTGTQKQPLTKNAKRNARRKAAHARARPESQ